MDPASGKLSYIVKTRRSCPIAITLWILFFIFLARGMVISFS
ncbi:MAG: hypothetical protein QXV59_07865 [Nitrososphaerota archaeon]